MSNLFPNSQTKSFDPFQRVLDAKLNNQITTMTPKVSGDLASTPLPATTFFSTPVKPTLKKAVAAPAPVKTFTKDLKPIPGVETVIRGKYDPIGGSTLAPAVTDQEQAQAERYNPLITQQIQKFFPSNMAGALLKTPGILKKQVTGTMTQEDFDRMGKPDVLTGALYTGSGNEKGFAEPIQQKRMQQFYKDENSKILQEAPTQIKKTLQPLRNIFSQKTNKSSNPFIDYLGNSIIDAFEGAAIGVVSGVGEANQGAEEFKKNGVNTKSLAHLASGGLKVAFAPAMTKFNTVINSIPGLKEITNPILETVTTTAIEGGNHFADQLEKFSGVKGLAENVKTVLTPVLENAIPMLLLHGASKYGLKLSQDVWNAAKGIESVPMAGEQVQSFAGSSTGEGPTLQPSSTPESFSPTDYVKELTTQADQARKAEKPQLNFKERLSKISTKAQTAFSDAAAPVEKMIREAEKSIVFNKGEIKPSQEWGYHYDNALVAPKLAENFMKESGLIDTLGTIPKGQEKAFQEYLKARQIQDLTPEQQQATGRNLQKDQQLIQHYKDQFEPFAQKHTEIANKLLDYSVEKGLLDPEMVQQLKKQYPNYVPLNRIFNELEGSNPNFVKGAAIGSLGKQDVVQKMGSSSRTIEDPSVNLIHKIYTAFNEGERNTVATKTIDLKNIPGLESQFKAVDANNTPSVKTLNSQGLDVISRMINGKPEKWIVPKELAAFAKAYDTPQLGVIEKAIMSVQRTFKAGTTALNPVFALGKNLIKDIQTGAINKKGTWKGMLNPKTWKDAFGAATGLDKAAAAEVGRQGMTGSSFDVYRDINPKGVGTYEYTKSLQNLRSKMSYTLTHPSQWARAFEDLLSTTERATRDNIYFTKKADYLKEGYSKEDAIKLATQDSRTGTANFTRSGTYARQLSVMGPYIRAAIRGADAFRQGVREQGALPMIAKVVGYGVMPTLALYAWNTGTPERQAAYNDINEQDKKNYFLYIPPNPTKDEVTGKWSVFKIPKSQELAALSEPFEKMISKDKSGLAMSILQALQQTTIGVDVTNPVANVVPQILKGPLENRAGKAGFDYYYGQPLMNDKLASQSPGEQYIPGKTSATARALSEIPRKLGLEEGSPIKMEHLLQTTFGDTALQGLNLADRALAALHIIKNEDVGGRDTITGLANVFTKAQGGAENQKAFAAKDQADMANADENAKISRGIDEFFKAKNKESFLNFYQKVYKDLPDDKKAYAQKYLRTLLKFENMPKEVKTISKFNGDEALNYWKDNIDIIAADMKNDPKGSIAKFQKIREFYKDKPAVLSTLGVYFIQKTQSNNNL